MVGGARVGELHIRLSLYMYRLINITYLASQELHPHVTGLNHSLLTMGSVFPLLVIDAHCC